MIRCLNMRGAVSQVILRIRNHQQLRQKVTTYSKCDKLHKMSISASKSEDFRERTDFIYAKVVMVAEANKWYVTLQK